LQLTPDTLSEKDFSFDQQNRTFAGYWFGTIGRFLAGKLISYGGYNKTVGNKMFYTNGTPRLWEYNKTSICTKGRQSEIQFSFGWLMQ
jgi:hypothetical protein